MDRFSLPSWSARNPLGIIALFISLIYGMSALLLGTSIGQLTTSNQTILVDFIIGFPFVVLGVFAWLVARHHRKLYGPGDYRSDEGFLEAANTLPPAALGARLRNEIEVLEDDRDDNIILEEPETSPKELQPREVLANQTELQKPDDEVLLAYSIENLVFQELEREFGSPIRRGVVVARPKGQVLHLDGVLDVNGEATFIEIKMLRTINGIRHFLSSNALRYRAILDDMKKSWPRPPRFLLAVVYNGPQETARLFDWVKEQQGKLGDDLLVRAYGANELLLKYGLFGQQFETKE